MATTAPTKQSRPFSVRLTISLLVFLGVTAAAGGFVMATAWGGEQVRPPREWLDGIPLVSSWVVPGLVLGLGFGLGSLVVAWGMARRPRWPWLGWVERRTGEHWSWLAAVVVGAGQVVWIALELVYLPALSWFHPLYGAVGLALVAAPLSRSGRAALRVRGAGHQRAETGALRTS